MRAKILNASAGSGKTWQLAYKYVRDVVEQPALYRHILAVTFTNKATEEMKSRILKEIHKLASDQESDYLEKLVLETGLDAQTVRRRARDARQRILHDYSHFTVLTIDTFFQRILRAFIKELGLDLSYNVEIETASVLAKGTDTLIDRIADDGELRRWMTEFVEERIASGGRWDIRDGMMALGGELFKERNKEAMKMAYSRDELRGIIGRITRKADASKENLRQTAARAVEIISAAGCSASDFSGKSRSFALWFYAIAEGDFKEPTATVRAKSLTTEGWCTKGSPSEGLAAQLQPLLKEMCEAYDGGIRLWNTCDLLRETYRSFAMLADLYKRVQELCEEQNLMLLSETKYLLAAFIEHNDAPFIYEKVGNRFERFMIDEFQDTSVKEWENFLPLLRNAMSQEEKSSVLLVGDIKQSIYRWRGGDWQLLHSKAAEDMGREDTAVENLTRNFRSLPAIVHFNNRVIAQVVAADNGRLNASIAEAVRNGDITAERGKALENILIDAYRTVEQHPKESRTPGYVSVETFAEQPPVIGRICELIDRGFLPSDIMILVRGATDGERIAAELLEFKRRNTDPRYHFDVMTREALIVGNAPVSSFVEAAMTLSLNSGDTLARARYNHYLGHAFDRPLDDVEHDFFRSIRLLSPEEAFERIVMRHNLDGDRLQTAYLQAIHEQIIAFTSSRIADIALWLKWWQETGSARSLSVEASERAVEITTIHKAKGLEKSAIIVPYCSWQLDPRSGGGITNIVWAEARGDAAEVGRFPVKFRKSMGVSGFSDEYFRERVFSHVDNINLLYVALTRARESLHIFIPQTGRGEHVGTLLLQTLQTEGTTVSIADTEPLHATDEARAARVEKGAFEGRHNVTDSGERFEFGEFASPVPQKEREDAPEHITLEHYPTSQADLKLRLPSQRYFEDGADAELSPRNFGILMHKAFEQAEDVAAITRAVDDMVADGTISAADAATLSAMIGRALADPMVGSWFDGSWQQVRTEGEILVPGAGTIRRPDRVMISGQKAVVVDYKFGDLDTQKYRRQVSGYCRLLRDMGYSETEGYLWFVKRGEIEKVE